MASPRIDRPCPLGVDEQRRINGWCGQCRSMVHCLDSMDDSARRALLAAATGPICVSYRRGAATIAATALLIGVASAPPASAVENGGAADDKTFVIPDGNAAGATSLYADRQVVQLSKATGEPEVAEDEGYILVGGISDPQAVEWDQDDAGDLPELPVVVDP